MEDSQIIIQNKKVKCQAIGVRFISGIASRYDDNYPAELEGYISGLVFFLIFFFFSSFF